MDGYFQPDKNPRQEALEAATRRLRRAVRVLKGEAAGVYINNKDHVVYYNLHQIFRVEDTAPNELEFRWKYANLQSVGLAKEEIWAEFEKASNFRRPDTQEWEL